VSHAGKEAVIAVLDAGTFFGEGSATGTAMSDCSVTRIRQEGYILIRPSRILSYPTARESMIVKWNP
jgi:hypothetical protein